jgi:magnesium-transporting ATPase (P-type)
MTSSVDGKAFSELSSTLSKAKGLGYNPKEVGHKSRQNNKRMAVRGGSTPSPEVPLVLDESGGLQLVISDAHWMSANDCLEGLSVFESTGLSMEEAFRRKLLFGSNSLPSRELKPLWRLIAEQFQDRLVQILLAVAVLSAFLATLENDGHAFAEPLIIATILLINAAVGVYQGRSAEDSIEALKKLQPNTACVLRGGNWWSELPVADIVPGDIIYLRVGDKVPADARLIALKTTTFSTDESALTGESVTASKSLEPVDPLSPISGKSNMVFSGTMVANGGAFAVVTGTGKATEIGKIDVGLTTAEASKTPLTERLDEFGDQLSKIIGAICVVVWLASIPKFSSPLFGSWVKGAIYHAKIAVALGVAAIPEGLPAVITLCLSLGTHRMAKKNVIVRNLPSVETLGCTSVICTDKTGTLTTNQMTVKSLVTFESFTDDNHNVASTAVKSLLLFDDNLTVSGVETVVGEVATDDVDGDKAELQLAESESSIDSSTVTTDVMVESAESEEEIEDIPSVAESGINIVDRSVDGVSYEPIGDIEGWSQDAMQSPALQDLAAICSLCNEAQLEYKEGVFGRIGEPTEAALKVLVEKMGATGLVKQADPHSMIRQSNAIWHSKYEKLAVLEFNRDRKSMSVLCKSADMYIAKGGRSVKMEVPQDISNAESEGDGDGGDVDFLSVGSQGDKDNILFVKGAAEVLVERCNRVKLADGQIVPITSAVREKLRAKFNEMACQPLRTLAMAYR